jgi:glyoxylase-like metal-dependent hydrolase (beta-lactamase superfamily II)/rhodanese-related sulfurtransferase
MISDDHSKNPNINNNNNLKIKPADLKKKIDDGEDIYILDVRDPQEHKAWKVFYDRYDDTPLIPVDSLLSSDSLKNIPKDKEVVTFCAKGNRSMSAAQMLSARGYNVKSMEGGLSGWNTVYDTAELLDIGSPSPPGSSSTTSPPSLKVWQIRRVSRGCMSYVIANLDDKKAAVIDPTCEIDDYLGTIVNENNLKITAILDTHLHADHLSGNTKLAKKYGCDLYVSALEPYELNDFPNADGLNLNSLKDGDKINIGNGVVLDAIHTPGHTNGSVCFKLQVGEPKETGHYGDGGTEKKNGNPNSGKTYLFTGDTLFVDGVGRPDLHNKAEEFTRHLYNSYRQKILRLPDETMVLPSHFSERFEHGKPIHRTLKLIKENMNILSDTVPESEFTKSILSSIPSQQPMNYEKIVSINKGMVPCNLAGQGDLETGPNSCGIRA